MITKMFFYIIMVYAIPRVQYRAQIFKCLQFAMGKFSPQKNLWWTDKQWGLVFFKGSNIKIGSSVKNKKTY